MQIAKYRDADGAERVAIVRDGELVPLVSNSATPVTLTEILESDNPEQRVSILLNANAKPSPVGDAALLAPIDQHEIWAAGVTYKRSKTARMEESESAATLYDRVYAAARPELFFKATPHRVSGPGQPVRIRDDSHWNVPEPELALVLNSRLRLVGFTIGNDMSSRDIEGENPLYLPQAKLYDACCGLGPWITLGDSLPPAEQVGIRLTVVRQGNAVFEGATNIGQMARSFDELIGWLGRNNSFPGGVVLLTGTGIVPDASFTLAADDIVRISIDGLGALENPVVGEFIG